MQHICHHGGFLQVCVRTESKLIQSTYDTHCVYVYSTVRWRVLAGAANEHEETIPRKFVVLFYWHVDTDAQVVSVSSLSSSSFLSILNVA